VLIAAFLALQTQAVRIKPNTVALTINQRIPPNLNEPKQRSGSWAKPMTDTVLPVGGVSWSVENTNLEGAPCLLFRGESKWQTRVKDRRGRPTKVVLKPTLYFFSWVSPEGRLLKTSTSFAGFGTPVQVEAIYGERSIEMTRVQGTDVQRTTLFPKFAMERFHGLFEPLVHDGLEVKKEHVLAFLHPLTAAPVVIKVQIDGRFQGRMYDVRWEGYRIKTLGPEGSATQLVSREGQLLQLEMPDKHEAQNYASLTNTEMRAWGRFAPGDWQKPVSTATPQRPRWQALMVPIMLKDPRMVYPVPYAVAL
jgi:hypothetical protein